MAVVSGVTLVTIHYSLLIFVLVAVSIMSIIPKFFKRKIKKRTQALSTAMELFKKELDNLVQGRFTLGNFTAFNWIFSSIKEQSLQLKRKNLENTLSVRTLQGIIVILNICSQLEIIGLAGFLAYLNLISFPIIFSVGQVAGQMFSSITSVINGIPEYDSLSTLLDKFPSIIDNKKCNLIDSPMKLEEGIRLSNVKASLQDKTIKFPNIHFLAGKKYVITGKSGSGKSTLLNTLNGEIRTFSGEIYWDETPYSSICTSTLKNSLVTMSQNTHLFNKSIRDNIIMERELDEILLQEILQKTHLDSLINQLDKGLDTVIDADSIKLAGGQIQRIALARCLYHQPNILLIDKGTANIDVNTAIDIEKLLFTASDITVIMVSHHLSDEIRLLTDDIINI
ncbi:ABC transporter ATP-binding protein [Aerococcaceae bacterium zg-ZJ1578]|uniref:ATP-binding cassette domain-containing protein n=1 Tax=Aerococcaceae bacterium zg-252 TaxID=2796928 RepID=UPI001A2580EF|nr:ABC transporter ATP-binding protein [Aerococcaceae bacterium zg-1578]